MLGLMKRLEGGGLHRGCLCTHRFDRQCICIFESRGDGRGCRLDFALGSQLKNGRYDTYLFIRYLSVSRLLGAAQKKSLMIPKLLLV